MFFGREPESEDVVRFHMKCENLLSMRQTFVLCPEFSRFSKALPLRLFPHLDKIEVDIDVSEDQFRACITRIKEAWTHLGNVKPHYSVLTNKRFLPENINGSIERFWASGEDEAITTERILARNDCIDLSEKVCVEYGCGVGRITMGLASRFAHVHGYDISPAHLSYAQQRAKEIGVTNVTLHQCGDALIECLHECEVFHSKIVFQHNPPPVIKQLVKNALRALKPGGIAIFQVPTYMKGYRFRITEWLNENHPLKMQMHCLPQQRIFEIICEEDCTLLEVGEDNSTGLPEKFISNSFVIRKNDRGV
jgi:2-polyprenyl-3-methyl-5-hydroxy-6-metoxy-1,4-benzoquinol methylase